MANLEAQRRKAEEAEAAFKVAMQELRQSIENLRKAIAK